MTIATTNNNNNDDNSNDTNIKHINTIYLL